MVFDESMKRYLQLLEGGINIVEEEPLFEEVHVDAILDQHDMQSLLEDLSELAKKLDQYHCTENNQTYAEGFEAGMFNAASLLSNLLETKYNKKV